MKDVTKKLVETKRQKAVEMAGKKIYLEVSHKILSVDKEKHTAVFVMSTGAIDRHGEKVDQNSWIIKYFLENPYFALQHRSDEFPIGKWIRIWFESDPENPGEQMMLGEAEFRVEFEDAARAFRHVEVGDMSMVSVGFIPHRVEYDETLDIFVLYDCELVECSLVGIGSNRAALIKEVKEMKDLKKDTAIDNAIKARELINTELSFKIEEDQKRLIRKQRASELISKAIRQLENI